MSRPDPRNVCDGCGQTFDRRRRDHVELGPIVHTRVWRRLADDPRECLCLECMDRRASERLRPGGLALNDLRLCRWNLEWLDVFVDADDELLRAVAAFAMGGLTALADQRIDAARKLLGQLK